MASLAQSSYTNQQIATWLRGLLTIAWADGDFGSQEKELIAQLTQDELAPTTDLGDLEQISPEELAAALGKEKVTAENFLRTAVMVAVADGVYSDAEADILASFCQALGLEVQALKSLEHTLYNSEEGRLGAAVDPDTEEPAESPYSHSDILRPARDWLDGMDIQDPRVARFVCKMVPSQCPFERDVKVFERKLVHLPPLCKLNPLYEQLVGLRFRALSYLADECQEDVSSYI
ncbi:MAG: nitrogenase [Cyanobacteria bacterium QH_8_48_120]|nr:MAG: nitrogenase [Cyanobacteria bacterium QH_7_48_89]PSO70250.1 MAG: nitrogenase [Cyanobacteria bacterium QS_1_48_34]PSO74515.1 MAG: nitrogenase [Cyanobacteria bacterium QH_8_48_120]PSO80070.1 MAG: nitrogenase [Cyanobacteria bacterium QS_4_48_99]PSO87574.1 MAG: nitrogenase [Cyanobacteria bacterium QH_9_48_43]PSP06533.1 MAG: nitrogenase [Cyanobacteria bacterium SW_12_48_29]PSP22350.1 MAG: nitrogenase [Cyanobacteria bacterium SW_5_48_44]